MQLYDTTELERIDKVKTSNDKMEEFFTQKMEEWNGRVNPIFEVINQIFELFNRLTRIIYFIKFLATNNFFL